jgi:hypothetical protein
LVFSFKESNEEEINYAHYYFYFLLALAKRNKDPKTEALFQHPRKNKNRD